MRLSTLAIQHVFLGAGWGEFLAKLETENAKNSGF
jgi:hypothetical protein